MAKTTAVLYIPRVQERGLEERFGADYVLYKANVPRWLPCRTAWELPNVVVKT